MSFCNMRNLSNLSHLSWNQILRIHILIQHYIFSTHQVIILNAWFSLVDLLNSKTLYVEITKALVLCLHLLFYISKHSLISTLSLTNLYMLMWSTLLFSDKTFLKIYIFNQFLHVCSWICSNHCKLCFTVQTRLLPHSALQ